MTLELRRGEVVGLIGPNGAGKTTLVNVVTGFDAPTSGSVELEGRDVTRWRPHRLGRAGLARTFQGSHSFASLSVRENVEVSALGGGAGPREARRRADELLELLGIGTREDVPASALSTGTSGNWRLPARLRSSPRFVFMDEPAAGLPEAEIPSLAEVLPCSAR